MTHDFVDNDPHSCPVSGAFPASKARISAGFEAKMRGVDLTWTSNFRSFFEEMLKVISERRRQTVSTSTVIPASISF